MDAYFLDSNGRLASVRQAATVLLEIFDAETVGRIPTRKEYERMATLFEMLRERIVGNDAAATGWRFQCADTARMLRRKAVEFWGAQ